MLDKLRAMLAHPQPQKITRTEEEIAHDYPRWRWRVMSGMLIGYALFYFCRKNFSMVNKPLSEEFGFSATQMGVILSTATILYAFSKFFSGVLADRMNARYLMGFGLILSAIVSILFALSPNFSSALGLSSPLIFFIIFWSLNNLFQGTGVPPCSKALTYWYAPKESGTAWGIWNSSHQIGGALILILSGYLVANYGWESAFYVPAVICLLGGLFIIAQFRDTPQSMGLPSVEVFKKVDTSFHEASEEEQEAFWPTMQKYILKNPMIWLVCIGNFFIYIVRISVLDWGPRFLQESKGFSEEASAFAASGFELSGILGAFISGWISDVVFKGRRGPVMVVFMLALALCIYGLLVVGEGQQWTIAWILIALGFFVYGPQMLVAVAAADFATKKAAATAVGLTGFFGYAGATVSGIGTGMIVDRLGWNGAFIAFIIVTLIGTVIFAFTWNRRAPSLDSAHGE
ncbi:MAG: MFS transporter [Chthoniobacterales bacterium]